MTCLAVGLIASGALGATTIAMVDHATGSSILDVTAAGVAGSTRTIDIMITTDTADRPDATSPTGFGGLVSWGINGLQPPGAGFKVGAQITTTNYVVGDAFDWDSTGALTTAKGTYPLAWPALPQVSLGTIAYIDTTTDPATVWPAFSGQAMSFSIVLPASNIPLGKFTGQSVYAGLYPTGVEDVTFQPLTLTPEPVSALLLLAGLPLLRRRR